MGERRPPAPRSAAPPRPPGGPVALLATAVLLSALTEPAFLLAREPQDLPTEPPASGLHVHFDPTLTRLTWDCQQNATHGTCVMNHTDEGPITKRVRAAECECTFPELALHAGVTLRVELRVHQRLLSETVEYTNPGREGTAAQNLSCLIYEADFMNCTWARGRAAPADVQYSLYIRSKRRLQRECPQYLSAAGTRVGCHLRDLSGLTSYAYFLLNGSSRETGIQFFDEVLLLRQIERYSPPRNITVHCNASHCLIRWTQPRTRQRRSSREFQYQLDIRRERDSSSSRNQLIVVFGDAGDGYLFPGATARHSVRIRTADARGGRWGAWSEPVEFGSEEPGSSQVPIYVLVVLGTLVCGLTVSCLFKRILRRHPIFPPVPRIKDKLNEKHPADPEVIWETAPHDAGKGDKEDVLTVEEVTGAPGKL